MAWTGSPRGVAFALALATWAPVPAAANGLTTHVFITLDAARQVEDPEIGALVRDPAVQSALLSGTIFPDGGYAVGDGYGERAHWEPFQLAYLEAIRARYAPPWSPEARQHIAFLLGMTSHGMADQVFDSLYMERARQHDHASDWANHSMDEATDVAFAARVGAQPVPDRFLPADLLAEVFEARGHRVAPDTLQRGQGLAGLAVAVVGMLGEDRAAVRDYRGQFPWATAHIDDPAVPGGPRFESAVIAAYWGRIWARLHGRAAEPGALLASAPGPGGLGHARTATAVESRVALIFADRLLRDDVAQADLRWRAGGADLEFTRRLFYRDDSHVLLLSPSEDLAADTDQEVRVVAGLMTAASGAISQDILLGFSTRAPPVEAPIPEASGCRATGGQGPAWWLLGLLLMRRRRRRARRRGPRTPPRR